MISRITYPILTFLFCITFSAYAQLDSLYTQQWNRDPINNLSITTSAQRQIITSEQIRVSGYTQLSQVFQLIDGWTIGYYTANWHSPRLQSNGTGSYTQQNWVLMLNGQRIELNRDELNVDDLAIPVYDIERIEIINSNGMYLGEFAQYGLINIITKKDNKKNLNVGTMISSSQNIHNTGIYGPENNIITSVGYTKNKLHLNATMSYMDFSYEKTDNDNQRLSSGIELQYTGSKISHQIQTKSLGVYRMTDYRLLGYLMQWNIDESNQIRLSSSANWNELYSGNASQFKNTLQHRYLKSRANGNFIWQNGIGYDYIHSEKFWINPQNLYVHIVKPYSSINIPITPRINLFADAQAAFAHDKIAPKFSMGMYKRVSLISNYSFVVAYTETLLEESFLTTVNQDINAIEGAPYYYNPKLATADFYYNLNFGNSVKFSFNSGLKNAYDLVDYTYAQVQTAYTIERSTYQLNWVNRFNFHYDLLKNLVVDVNYMNTRIVNTWNENLRNIPKHKFTFILQYDLPKRFTFWSRNYIQSKTELIPGSIPQDYLGYPEIYFHTPTQFGWEIGFSKKLFKEYLHLNLTARNLLAKEVYYNPDQLHYSGRLFMSIVFNINGIGGSKAPKQ